jgi:hypothetical protein
MNDAERNQLVEQHLPACRRMAGLWGNHARRAGLNVDSEDLYSEAYTYLLTSIIPRYDASRGVPLQQWVNLNLRGWLSNHLLKKGRDQGREIVTDIDDLVGIAALPQDENSAEELRSLITQAYNHGVITFEQVGLLGMISTDMDASKAGQLLGIQPRRAQRLVEQAKQVIRTKVLNLAD